jgi:8-oxo-dGTP diphosphatase
MTSQANKRVHVVAGIIWNAEKTALLISKRPEHLHKGGFWEFPGGKVESGESEIEALARELVEELSIEFSNAEKFRQLDFDYPDKKVSLAFYHVYDVSGIINGNQQQEWRWVAIENLIQYKFPEANKGTVEALVEKF